MTAKILRQADGYAGPAGDQRQIGSGFADALQIAVADRIGNGQAHALGAQMLEGLANGARAMSHDVVGHQTHLAAALPAEHAHQISIGHGRQGMMFHAAFI